MANKIGPGQEATQFAALIAVINDLQTQLNNLSADFRSHDHGSAYAAFNTRVSTVTNSLAAGTHAHTLSLKPVPPFLLDDSRL